MSIDAIDQRLNDRLRALDERIAKRGADKAQLSAPQKQHKVVKIEPATPVSDELVQIIAKPPSGRNNVVRMACAPYATPNKASAFGGFIGSLLYLIGVVYVCSQLQARESTLNIVMNIGLCGMLQSAIYFKTIGSCFGDAISSMDGWSWLGAVLSIFFVLALSAVLGPVMFALNCVNFVQATTSSWRGGAATLVRAVAIAGIIIGTVWGTMAVVHRIASRGQTASSQV